MKKISWYFHENIHNEEKKKKTQHNSFINQVGNIYWAWFLVGLAS